MHQIELEMQNEELRQTQHELAASRARYFDLYDLAPVGYLTLSGAGLIQQCNLTAAELLGDTREDLNQRPLSRFIDPHFCDRFQQMRRSLRTTRDPQSIEVQLLKQDGTLLWTQIEATSTQEDGAPVMRVVLSDVTLRKQAEAEHRLREQKEQAQQKLESLTVMAGGVAHDFNNLLTAILGSSRTAQRAMPPDSPVQKKLEFIDETSQSAAKLCDQLLTYSGRTRSEPQRLDLNELIESTVRTVSGLISSDGELRQNLTAGLPAIEGDATQLGQVVMNLVINASEALIDGRGKIMITSGLTVLDQTQQNDPLAAPELPEGDYVFLSVTDNGYGMNWATLARVFEPFFTTKSTGRGLGMAAVQGIVQKHGGALKVKSEPGRGTTFRLLLAAASGPVESRADGPSVTPSDRQPAVASADGEWRGSGIVLLAEDIEIIRLYAKEVIEATGLDCVLAADGQEALDVFQSDPDRFKLVILDLKMPRLGGLDAFREMQRLRPDVQAVMMSGYGLQDASSISPGKGPVGFLTKPFAERDMIALLKKACG